MKRIVLLFIPVLFLIGGCKKNNPISAALAKVKTVAFSYPGYSETYTNTYTSDGKLLLYQGSLGDKISYNYNGSTVTVNQYDSSGALSESDLYYLNSQGLADSVVMTFTGYYMYARFVYDANGHNIKKTLYDGTNTLLYTYNWTITNGNATYYYYTDNGGNTVGTQTTTYTDKLTSTGNQNGGLAFMGASSVNLAASATTTGATSASYTYTYTFDSNGLETSMTSSGSGTPITWNYTYY